MPQKIPRNLTPSARPRFGKMLVDPETRPHNLDVARYLEREAEENDIIKATLYHMDQAGLDVFVWFPYPNHSSIQIRNKEGGYLGGDREPSDNITFNVTTDSVMEHAMRLWSKAMQVVVKLLLIRSDEPHHNADTAAGDPSSTTQQQPPPQPEVQPAQVETLYLGAPPPLEMLRLIRRRG